MNRFLGGFMTAVVPVTLAAIAGRGWLTAALAVASAACVLWLAVLMSRRSAAAREKPGADLAAAPFGARKQERETVNRR